MRIAVDVGSNSAHVKVVDLRPGDAATVESVKRPTRLAEAITGDGAITEEAVDRLVSAVAEAVFTAGADHAHEFIAFATSAVRDATNREAVTARVATETGVRLGFLTGRDEARLTFLAARAWHGWSAGTMLLLDIGGGSLGDRVRRRAGTRGGDVAAAGRRPPDARVPAGRPAGPRGRTEAQGPRVRAARGGRRGGARAPGGAARGGHLEDVQAARTADRGTRVGGRAVRAPHAGAGAAARPDPRPGEA